MKQLLIAVLMFTAVLISACSKTENSDVSHDANLVLSRLFPEYAANIKYQKVKKLKSGVIQIKNVEWPNTVNNKPVYFDELDINKFDYNNSEPHFYKITLKGLQAKNYIYENKMLSKIITQAGLDKVVENMIMDLTVEQDWNPDGRTYEAAITFKLRGFVEIDVSYTLANIKTIKPKSDKPANLRHMNISLKNSKLKQLSVLIRNKNLIQTITKNSSPELLQETRKLLEAKVEKSGNLYQNQISSELSNFLFGHKNSLYLTIMPKKPVSIETIITTIEDLYHSDAKSKQHFFDDLNVDIKGQ